MHPALKKIFCHPIMIQESVQSVDPEMADRIDFSTLEALGPDLVGDELASRFPEMLWIARTREPGGHVVILLHFQARSDPLMPVRVAVHGRQTLCELHRRMRPPPDPGSLETLPLVIHHGSDRWTAPQSLEELLTRCEAGDYRVVTREPGTDAALNDLGGMVPTVEPGRCREVGQVREEAVCQLWFPK